jgi:hypothetical protein
VWGEEKGDGEAHGRKERAPDGADAARPPAPWQPNHSLFTVLYPSLPQSRTRSFLVRLGSTIVLIATFAGIIYLGHVPLAVMILGIQVRKKERGERKRESAHARFIYFFNLHHVSISSLSPPRPPLSLPFPPLAFSLHPRYS